MPDQPTQRDRIRAALEEAVMSRQPAEYRHVIGENVRREWDLIADHVDEALSTTATGTGEGQVLPPLTHGERTGPALVGPFLTPHELTEIRQRNDGASGAVTRLLRHVDAQAAVIATQNREMDRLQGQVRELGRLQSEVVRLLEIGEADPDDIWADSIPEHLWRREPMVHATEEEYPAIFAVLRAAQAEREGRRG